MPARPSAELVADLDRVAALLRTELQDGSADPAHSLATARALDALAQECLRHLVDSARDRGASWQRIGEALGTSRQAAFQRFGAPIDPRTGAPMTRTTLPDAEARAVAFFARVAEHDWGGAARDFGTQVAEQLGADGLADAYAQVVAFAGRLESTGEPVVRPLADLTVVEVPLHHEAADLIGRVSYDTDARIVGLWFVPAETAGG